MSWLWLVACAVLTGEPEAPPETDPAQEASEASSQASAAVGGNPTAATVGQQNTPWSASAETMDDGLASIGGLTADSRRTAASVPGQIATAGDLHGKQSASAMSSGASQNLEAHDSLDGTELSARQNTTPRQIAGEQSILNPGKASSAVPLTAQMTAQMTATMTTLSRVERQANKPNHQTSHHPNHHPRNHPSQQASHQPSAGRTRSCSLRTGLVTDT